LRIWPTVYGVLQIQQITFSFRPFLPTTRGTRVYNLFCATSQMKNFSFRGHPVFSEISYSLISSLIVVAYFSDFFSFRITAILIVHPNLPNLIYNSVSFGSFFISKGWFGDQWFRENLWEEIPLLGDSSLRIRSNFLVTKSALKSF
jgi:hypothetical protein